MASVRAGLTDEPRQERAAFTDNVPVVKVGGKFIFTLLFSESNGVMIAAESEKLQIKVSTPAGSGAATL
jgi:hypothetical protein